MEKEKQQWRKREGRADGEDESFLLGFVKKGGMFFREKGKRCRRKRRVGKGRNKTSRK